MRTLIAVLLAFSLLVPAAGTAQNAPVTFECDGGANAAIVNACAVRWEAANIRAHVAAGVYGGATPKCLERTAWLLDDVAGKWLKRNAFNPFNGPWPCGKHPALAKADDGVLAAACPSRVWSYDNRGAAGCNPARQEVAQQQPKRMLYIPTPAPAPTPFNFDNVSNVMAARVHHYRWWDGGSVNAGDYHDRTSWNSALFNACNFTIEYHESDLDGRTWEQTWSGNLRNANPYAITVTPIASEPAEFILHFETTGRAALFQYTGTFRPNNAESAVTIEFPYNPQYAVTALRNAILWCKSQ